VDKAVQQPRLNIERTSQLVLVVFVCAPLLEPHTRPEVAPRTEVVCDEVECLRVVLHLRVQAGQVEAVEDVVLLDLAEVFIALGRQEP
jgi:hypothetical protein